ncbi:unnamed protein product [Diatraea saccharalis]|uniref:Uncharacterized protein n=1 Tax=Diatraea saccharalis TaxID=40085 RepID=A0A9N9R2H3_9NEOP|nr:unnamed protein product [Diatraea saccharalis]
MIRWRYCLVLAMLLLLPTRNGSKIDDDDDEDRNDENEEEDDDDEDEEEEEVTEKTEHMAGRRAPAILPSPKSVLATRTLKKRPLECYVCAYKNETPLRACLDPTKYRVHTITCHSSEDKCFTSVISKGASYEAVVRGCRSGCVGSPETTCCELNRCNNQAFAMPVVPSPRALMSSDTRKVVQPTVLFFVTILLLLQTVVKVAVV